MTTAEQAPPAQPQPGDGDAALGDLVRRRVTCPFVGSAVRNRALAVTWQDQQPLASIAAVRRLGNSGGGRLGVVLGFFACANHRRPVGAGGSIPAGLFSLDFPGSQGSHPGHSGILEGDPAVAASGRFSREDLDRLTGLAVQGRIGAPALARFIGENLRRDPASVVLGWRAAGVMSGALAMVAAAVPTSLLRALTGQRPALDPLATALGRLLGCNNLIGSAGEFGLLLAFLEASPRSAHGAAGPEVAVADLEDLFARQSLPAGWDAWPKRAGAWAGATVRLAWLTLREYRSAASAGR